MPDVWGGDPGGGRACSVERMGVRGGPAPLAARSACTCAPRRAGRCEAAPASLLRLEATVAPGPSRGLAGHTPPHLTNRLWVKPKGPS